MSQQAKEAHESMEHSDKFVIPAWAKQIIKFSSAITPYFLAIAFLCLGLIVPLLFYGQTHHVWVKHVVSAMLCFGTVGMLTLLIKKFRSLLTGWISIAASVLFYYGAPFGVRYLAGAGPGQHPSTAFVDQLVHSCEKLAFAIAIISLMHLIFGFILQFIVGGGLARTRKIKYLDTSKADTLKKSLIPNCWQMARCRPGVRMTCPNYIDRKTCWKRRSGCFCDRELANYLVGNVDRGEAQEVIDMQKAVGGMRSVNAMRGKMKASKKRPWNEQKRLCHTCPLFIEHQEYKYRNLNWICFPITAAIAFASFYFFDIGYQFGAKWLDTMMKNLPLPEGFKPDASTSLVNSPFEYVVFGVLVLILFSYVISLVEVMFLKWKW